MVCLALAAETSAQTGTFIAPPQYPSGIGGMAMVTADFNGDGKLDLVVVDDCPLSGCVNASSTVSLLLGNGDGTFQPPVNLTVGSYVAVGDFNGDGKLDLVVANYNTGTMGVLFGNGDGTFQARVDYATGANPNSLAVGDFNGDGKLDIAVVNSVSASVSVFLNDGSGGFATRKDFATGYAPTSIAVGDFTGDGRLDLAITTSCGNVVGCNGDTTSGTVSFLQGNGDGTFQSHGEIPVAVEPVFVTAADIDGDGKLDLAVASYGSRPGGQPLGGNVTLLWGNGDGTFTPQNFTSGNSPSWMVVDDFNGDGQEDFAVVNSVDDTISVFLNQGHRAFTQPAFFFGLGDQARAAVAGDFNSDVKLDLAASTVNSGVAVLLGDGSGGFLHTSHSYLTGSNPLAVAVADLNRDGKNDVAVANFNDNDVGVALGNGDGTFAPFLTYATGNGPSALVIADLNHDGNPDLIVANTTANTVSILLNNGDGTFRAHVDYATGIGPFAVAVGDLNGDGIPDLAVTDFYGNSVSVLYGNGDGTFQAQSEISVGGEPAGLVLGDFNGDGRLDLAVVNSQDATLSVLLNNGNGTFGGPAPFVLQTPSKFSTLLGIAAGDFDGDGKLDLSLSGLDAGLFVLLGNGDGTFRIAANQPGTGSASLVVADFNGDGFPDVVIGGNRGALLYLGNGDGSFRNPVEYGTGYSSNYDSVATGDFNGDDRPDLGVANGGSLGGSNTLTILLNSAQLSSSFELAETPSSQTVTAGNSISFTVTGLTQNGFNGSISLTCIIPVSGATCSASPASITPGANATSTITVATGASTPAGTYQLGILGTSGNESFHLTPSVNVQSAPAPDFQISSTTLSPATVIPGGSASATIAATPVGGFSNAVTFSCSSIVLNGSAATAASPACFFNPAQLPNGTGSVTLTVSTTGSSELIIGPSDGRFEALYSGARLWIFAALALLGLGFSFTRKRPYATLILPVILLVCSCGGGSGATTSRTPSGTYTIVVAASSGGISHQLTLSLMVQ